MPGVGVRYDFTTEEEGRRVGVIHHRSGRREMFVCAPGEPDAITVGIALSAEDSHDLIDVLGGSQVIESLSHVPQHIEGLAIDWLDLVSGSPFANRTMGDAQIRTRTGVSVVAIIRGDTPHPAPGPDFALEAGDTLVVVGTVEGIKSASQILAND